MPLNARLEGLPLVPGGKVEGRTPPKLVEVGGKVVVLVHHICVLGLTSICACGIEEVGVLVDLILPITSQQTRNSCNVPVHDEH